MVLNTNSSIYQEAAETLREPFRLLSAIVVPLVTIYSTFIPITFFIFRKVNETFLFLTNLNYFHFMDINCH